MNNEKQRSCRYHAKPGITGFLCAVLGSCPLGGETGDDIPIVPRSLGRGATTAKPPTHNPESKFKRGTGTSDTAQDISKRQSHSSDS